MINSLTHPSVNLYWIPLGAGGHVVRWNGRIFEAIAAFRQHRTTANLYHAALQVQSQSEKYVIEMTPVWGNPEVDRGVVVEGPVMFKWLGRMRAFRYEVRCWHNGVIPDLAYAVESPVQMSDDPGTAVAVLDAARQLPKFTWGRDVMNIGDMWNSNSVVAWLLLRSGHDITSVSPPKGGRAPGWQTGVKAAHQ